MWFDEAVVYQIYPLGLCDALDKKIPIIGSYGSLTG